MIYMNTIHCDTCDKDFKKSYYVKHTKSKIHQAKLNGTHIHRNRDGYYKYDNVYCECCESSIKYYSYFKHQQSSTHKRRKLDYDQTINNIIAD